MDATVLEKLTTILDADVVSAQPLGGGCIADVARIDLADGSHAVAKLDQGPDARLDIEARMLADLAATGAVHTPDVIHSEPSLLVLEHIPNDGVRSKQGGIRFAESLAALHSVSADRFGHPYDTLIGPLDQKNTWSASWAIFYADQRVRPMAAVACERGNLSNRDVRRLDTMCAHMAELIGEPPARPAFIHGDLWAGNVLWSDGVVVGVIDPAVYHADPEIELAFIDLMGCFERSFFDRYRDVAGIRHGFWETRRDLYTLYPLLVHATLFGGGYGASAMATARRLGF